MPPQTRNLRPESIESLNITTPTSLPIREICSRTETPRADRWPALHGRCPSPSTISTSRRELNRFVTYRLMGTFGRPPDYAALNPLGLLSMAPEFAAMDPAWAENVERYVRWGRANCVVEADIVADVQSYRRIPIADKPGLLRIVSERSDGIVVYGSKPCNSVCAQGHVGTILTLLTSQANLDAALFGAIAMNAPGLTMVCREAMSSSMDEEDHPLDSRGEEIDAFMIFENVFIPHGATLLLQALGFAQSLPRDWGALPVAHHGADGHKGELLAGTAQVIANVLGDQRHIRQLSLLPLGELLNTRQRSPHMRSLPDKRRVAEPA